MSKDISACHRLGGGTIGLWEIEARDTTQFPIMLWRAPHNRIIQSNMVRLGSLGYPVLKLEYRVGREECL